jgi:hypothetical protein
LVTSHDAQSQLTETPATGQDEKLQGRRKAADAPQETPETADKLYPFEMAFAQRQYHNVI